MDDAPLPATETKHLDVVYHPLPIDSRTVFSLRQVSETSVSMTSQADSEAHPEGSDDTRSRTQGTGTTGTTLWLGAQVLACYLSSTLADQSEAQKGIDTQDQLGSIGRKRIFELGSGIGYLSLVLASMGYEVIATDIEPVLSSVLEPNIREGIRMLSSRRLQPGSVSVRQLDWEEYARLDLNPLTATGQFGHLDIVVMTDTIYHPPLIVPLFTTIRRLSVESAQSRSNPRSLGKPIYPTLYLALERRDSQMVDSALQTARDMGFELKRVGHGRVAKAVRAAGCGWSDEIWAGIEVWKGRFVA